MNLDYEQRHLSFLKQNASECCLFLKRDDSFPIEKPCSIVLLGNGARNTIKGGTGSGDVFSRHFKSIEKALDESGFNIVSKDWLDKYDEFKKSTSKDFIKFVKTECKKYNIPPYIYSMGLFEEEKNYNLNCNYDAGVCVYVLSRNSGEGNDRRNIKGDVKLSNKEVEDILYLNKKHKKFMLVLNVGGVVDLTPVLEVRNILLLSQLGVVTSEIFVDVLLGKVNPSGKLTTTWAKPEAYPSYTNFGNLHDTYYKEGIYVGYRYFSTFNKEVLFPFGFGLSYSNFEIKEVDTKLNGKELITKVNVKNIGKFDGKEVVQLYVSKPSEKLDQPSIELCGFLKTDLLKPNESKEYEIKVDFSNLSSFDEKQASSILLLKGNYIFKLGNSSNNLCDIVAVNLKDELVLEQLNHKCFDSNFVDEVKSEQRNNKTNLKTLNLDLNLFKTRVVEYKKDIYIEDCLKNVNNEALAYACLGHFKTGIAGMVGSSCEHVVGGAGETTLKLPWFSKSLTMADGPAGLRLKSMYGVDKKGVYDLYLEPFLQNMLNYLPKISKLYLKPPKHRHGEIIYQNTTPIPIGTALAQSFNKDFIYECGVLVNEEMECFGVDLWLAPALNIHRNILCGRNFEYYSEDPFLSGMVASFITSGVQSNSKCGVTIKHFACNNQELNRNHNNSHISERALREIYLKGFELCIKNSNPKAIMTSYNLINGVHTSESYELVNDILRCEWSYRGLVMSDWIATGRNYCKKPVYKGPRASKNVKAGNDLTMAGCQKDYKDILRALKNNELTREDLLISASRVYRSIFRK